MDQDHTFRLFLIIGFLIVLPIVLYHRLKSWAAGEKLDRRQEGLFILATLRPVASHASGWESSPTWSIRPGWPGRRCPSQPGCGGRESACCAIATGLLIWTLRSLGST